MEKIEYGMQFHAFSGRIFQTPTAFLPLSFRFPFLRFPSAFLQMAAAEATQTVNCGGGGAWVGCGGCAECSLFVVDGKTIKCGGAGGWGGCMGCDDCTHVVEEVLPPNAESIRDQYCLDASDEALTAQFGASSCEACKAKYYLFHTHTEFIQKHGATLTCRMYRNMMTVRLWAPCAVCEPVYTQYVSKLVGDYEEWKSTFDDYSECEEEEWDEEDYRDNDPCSGGICSCCGRTKD
jgi:hypothetical protein